jgi:hypothetical protein
MGFLAKIMDVIDSHSLERDEENRFALFLIPR